MNKKKDGRYVIDETTLLPDYLEKRHLYIHVPSKSIVELNAYEHFVITGIDGDDCLIIIENQKVAKLLYKKTAIDSLGKNNND
jgi:hypothetical protein